MFDQSSLLVRCDSVERGFDSSLLLEEVEKVQFSFDLPSALSHALTVLVELAATNKFVQAQLKVEKVVVAASVLREVSSLLHALLSGH